MITYIILVICLVILYYFNCNKKDYYTVLSCGGLGNRLRMILSCYKYTLSKNKHLKVYWRVNNEVSFSKFTDVFKPIKGILFIYEYNDEPVDYTSPDNCSILDKAGEFTYLYRYLQPTNNINKTIRNLISKTGNKYISMHIRRTDHIIMAENNNNYVSDIEYINYINNYPGYNIYLACDNRETQDKFINLYGNRIIINNRITDNNNLRKTSLGDSVIDIFMCVYSQFFKSAGFSSFSDTIKILRNVKS